MQGMSGVSAATPGRLILDAGTVYFNIDEDAIMTGDVADAIAGATALGATRGGATFEPGRSFREIEVDGVLGPAKGMSRRDRIEPTLTVTFVEMTKGNLTKAIAGAVSTNGPSYTRIEGGEIKATDYIENVALLATYSGTDDPVIVVVRNALVTEGLSLAFEDRNEVASEVVFAGHFDLADPAREPWAIYHPGQGVGS